MDGFREDLPVLAKVTWAEAEVELWSGRPTTYGLLAEVPGGNGLTRYFVPWDKITYLRQDLGAPPAAQAPTVITSPAQPGPAAD